MAIVQHVTLFWSRAIRFQFPVGFPVILSGTGGADIDSFVLAYYLFLLRLLQQTVRQIAYWWAFFDFPDSFYRFCNDFFHCRPERPPQFFSNILQIIFCPLRIAIYLHIRRQSTYHLSCGKKNTTPWVVRKRAYYRYRWKRDKNEEQYAQVRLSDCRIY